MKGYEFLEKIEKREIKKGTKFRIKHFNKEFIYEGGDTLKSINTNKEDDDVGAYWFINTEVEVIEENMATHHIRIETDKLKELINKNYNWNDYTLQGKIDIVTSLAYFDNDRELLEFLGFMEQ